MRNKKYMKLKIFGILFLFFYFSTAYCQKVTIFFSYNCPICQYYLPIISEIATQNTSITFEVILINKSDKKLIKKDFSFTKNVTLILDKHQERVQQYNATITPQAIVVCHDTIIYSGAIDDKYFAIGKYKQYTQANYLKDAIDYCTGKKSTLLIRHTEPIGCIIAN